MIGPVLASTCMLLFTHCFRTDLSVSGPVSNQMADYKRTATNLPNEIIILTK